MAKFQIDIQTIILAAGNSTRFGGEKQMVLLEGEPLFLRSVRQFLPLSRRLVLVVPGGRLEEYSRLVTAASIDTSRLQITEGGRTRTQSVLCGLAVLDLLAGGDGGVIAIHDAARPLASGELLLRLAAAALAKGGAAPGKPLTDTLLSATADGLMQASPPRENLWRIETPQVFRQAELLSAYRQLGDQVFTDDTQVFRQAGGQVQILHNASPNVKVTYPGDLEYVQYVLAQRRQGGK